MPAERAAGGVFLWLPFFAQAKKVTRSPAGRVEAPALKKEEQTKSENWIPAFAGITRNGLTSERKQRGARRD
jgi:hypothetical protein